MKPIASSEVRSQHAPRDLIHISIQHDAVELLLELGLQMHGSHWL